jgi:hypothetical protein
LIDDEMQVIVLGQGTILKNTAVWNAAFLTSPAEL